MTIASQTSRVRYTGDGSTTAFSIPYYFQANADIVVTVQDTAGTVLTKLLGTDYALSGQTSPSGGTCTFLTAPTNGYIISIDRDPPVTQTTSYSNNDPFPAKSHELALDKLTTLAQRDRRLIERAIVIATTDASPPAPLPPASARALNYLAFDGLGNPIAGTPVGATTPVSVAMKPVLAGATLAVARAAMGLDGFGIRENPSTNAIDVNSTLVSVSTTQTPGASNHLNRYISSAAVTITLPRASTTWNGYGFWAEAVGGDITLAPNAADTISGVAIATNFTIPMGAFGFVTTDGATNWYVQGLPYLSPVPKTVTGTYNVTAADNGKILVHTSGAFGTILFPAGSTLPAKFRCFIFNGETTAIGKGIGGVNVGSFTLYPSQGYLIGNIANTVVLLDGGLKRYKTNSVQIYGHLSAGSDNPLVADGLADGARAWSSQGKVKSALYGDFDHNGSQPTCKLTGNYSENITFGGQPVGCGVFFWLGTSLHNYKMNQVSSFCMIIGDGAVIEIGNIDFEAGGTAAVAIQLHQTAVCDMLAGINFGNFGIGNHVATDGAGWTFNVDASYGITSAGNASVHIGGTGAGVINITGGITVTTSGGPSPTMTQWFQAQGPVLINMGGGIAFTGGPAAGTTQWAIGPGSWLSRGGATIPGSVAGSPTAGSAPSGTAGWVS